MFEEVLGILGRPWLVVAAVVAVAVGTERGRKVTRKVVKNAVLASDVVGEQVRVVAGRVQEEFSDVVAEARAELKNGTGNGHENHKAKKIRKRQKDEE
jgi:hypothetical protein